MADELSSTYLNKNPLIRIFSRSKAKLALKIASLKKTDMILDFGCGEGWLKNNLKNQGYNVIGYDITPEHSDVKDYRKIKIKPNKIFVMDVFEHIPKEQIREIIKNFKKLNQNFELIASIPTENFVSRKARKILGKSEKVSGHITSIKEILQILKEERLILIKRINFLTVSYIAKFRSR
jgi:2-polyprenyl-3-methyl-5-hydroxy-6-metoxy-1,4-benzoquinol methylase